MVSAQASPDEREEHLASIERAVEAGALPTRGPARELLETMAKAGEPVECYKAHGPGGPWNVWFGMLDRGGRRVPCAEWRERWSALCGEIIHQAAVSGRWRAAEIATDAPQTGGVA